MQLAWLHAVPEGGKETRFNDKSIPSIQKNLPSVDGFEHVLQWFVDLGVADITYTEIKNWSEVTATKITAWHADTLKRMSVTYTSHLNKYRDKKAPAPFFEDNRTIEQIRADVAKKLKRNTGHG